MPYAELNKCSKSNRREADLESEARVLEVLERLPFLGTGRIGSAAIVFRAVRAKPFIDIGKGLS
jgi:hypothetical protein